MNESSYISNWQMWLRFVVVIRAFGYSVFGGKALRLVWVIMVLAVIVNGLNVVNSYVVGDFVNTIVQRDASTYIYKAAMFIGVFSASTVVTVLNRYAEDRLGLLFLEWMTRHLIHGYLDNRAYYLLKESKEIKYPSTCLSDDVRTCATATVSIFVKLLNASVAAIAFSGMIWTISPGLFSFALSYILLGSLFTILLGRPLVGLNVSQSDRVDDFRNTLIHVAEKAELIALARGENRLRTRLSSILEGLIDNMRLIFIINRNLNYFSTGYFNLMLGVPVIVMTPHYFMGEVDVGVIPQAMIAFALLGNACSIFINQFQSMSSLTAVLFRLNKFWHALEQSQAK